jgi:hypothetical protein
MDTQKGLTIQGFLAGEAGVKRMVELKSPR